MSVLSKLTGFRLNLISNALLRDWMTVLAGNGLRLALGLAASVIIARSLGPENLGIYAILTAVIAVTTTFSDLGLTNAAVRHVSRSLVGELPVALQFTWGYLISKTSLAILCSILGIGLSQELSLQIFGTAQFARLFVFGFLAVTTTALSNAITALLQAAGRFRSYTILQTINPLLSFIAILFIAALGTVTVGTLLWLVILLPLLVAAVGFVKTREFTSPSKGTSLSLRALALTVRQLVGFGKWVYVATAAGALFYQIDLILARHWLGLEAAGYYAIALGISMKAAILNGSLATTLLPRASKVNSTSAAKAYARTVLKRTVPASLIVLLTMPFIDLLVGFLYGEAFQPAAVSTQILLLVVVINLNVLPISFLFYPLDRPHFLALGELAKVLLLLLFAWPLAKTSGLPGIAASKLLAEILIGFSYFAYWKFFGARASL